MAVENHQLENYEEIDHISTQKGVNSNDDLNYLKNQLNITLKKNFTAKRTIDHLRSKSKNLKTNLLKAESINTHNIMLLQTQFEKEQNKWEKEKLVYQQEIHGYKRKIINFSHMLQKYQHNEMLFNTS